MKPLKNSQFYQLVVTQFLETIREPAVLFWGIGFPILISLGLGLAFTQNLEYKFNIAVVETHAMAFPIIFFSRFRKEKIICLCKIVYTYLIYYQIQP
jgi:hypothetical protein